jgi:hypothetical protein
VRLPHPPSLTAPISAIPPRFIGLRLLRTDFFWALASLPLIAVLMWLMLHDQLNTMFAAAFTVLLLIVAIRSRAAGAVCSLIYLLLLGDIRRIVSWIGEPPASDLLLLVGPFIAVVLASPLLLRIRLRDALSKAMLLLLVIMVLEIANPLQGGISVGLAGAIFYIAPVCWFWVGRQYASPEVIEAFLYRVLFPLSIIAAVLGLIQTFVGFLPWEQAWIDQVSATYTALHLGSTIRQFGFATSSAEHMGLMAMALVGICAAAFAGRKAWLVALPLLVIGVLLASGRTMVVKAILAIAVAWVFRKGAAVSAVKVIRLGVLTLTGLVAVSYVASHFALSGNPSGSDQSAASNALAHEASGLAHPFDPRYSTASIHGDMVATAISDAIARPLGAGLGATTAAAGKFGGGSDDDSAPTGSSEVDFTDMLLSLGVAGGLTYLFIIFSAFHAAIFYLKRVPARISLPLIAVLVVLIGSWMIGGQYGISSIVCFMLGALAKARDSEALTGTLRVAGG